MPEDKQGERVHAVVAVIGRRDDVLMVLQQESWAPEPFWTLPAGRVEDGEALAAGLAREVREETGLRLRGGAELLAVAQLRLAGRSDIGAYFFFAPASWSGRLGPGDPDGSILEARFVPLAQAAARLDAQPWPVVSHTLSPLWSGAQAGTAFLAYERDGAGVYSIAAEWPSARRLALPPAPGERRRGPAAGRRIVHVAVAIARRGGNVLLVQQQGPDDPQPYWSLPGGVVEPGELAHEALARELREETGLALAGAPRLAYVVQREDDANNRSVFVFAFAGAASAGALRSDDPDGLIRNVSFMPAAEAIACLREPPWAALREPAIAYLSGDAEAGRVWFYR